MPAVHPASVCKAAQMLKNEKQESWCVGRGVPNPTQASVSSSVKGADSAIHRKDKGVGILNQPTAWLPGEGGRSPVSPEQGERTRAGASEPSWGLDGGNEPVHTEAHSKRQKVKYPQEWGGIKTPAFIPAQWGL